MGPRNPYLCIVIVVALSLMGVMALAGMLYLSAVGKEPSQAVVTLAGMVVGALSSFLVTPPRGSVAMGGNGSHPVGPSV